MENWEAEKAITDFCSLNTNERISTHKLSLCAGTVYDVWMPSEWQVCLHVCERWSKRRPISPSLHLFECVCVHVAASEHCSFDRARKYPQHIAHKNISMLTNFPTQQKPFQICNEMINMVRLKSNCLAHKAWLIYALLFRYFEIRQRFSPSSFLLLFSHQVDAGNSVTLNNSSWK